MGWLYLAVAIVFEVAGTLSMKHSEGFSHWLPSVTTFVFYGGCLAFLTLAMSRIELSVVYAVWAGLGTALISLIGIFYYREPITMLKLLSITFILVGVIGLKIGATGE